MAEQTPTTTRPARTRGARPAAVAKAPATKPAAKSAPAAKAAPAKAEATAPAATNVTRFTVELEHIASTKSFEKFAFPDSYKGVVVGNVYAPMGTVTVKVLVIGDGDDGTE